MQRFIKSFPFSSNMSFPVSGTEGDDQDHHEKKSVLKKVKDKAKKIKDTIKKHGHGHGHEHGQEYDEEDDEDEEMEQDIAVKGGQSTFLTNNLSKYSLFFFHF